MDWKKCCNAWPGPNGLLVGATIFSVCLASLILSRNLERNKSESSPRSLRASGSREHEKAAGYSQFSGSKRLRSASHDSQQAMINDSFIANPVTADGFNELTNSHYKLTNEQIAAVNSSVSDARASILYDVVSNLKQEIDIDGKLVYSFDPSLIDNPEDFKSKLHNDLSRIVDEDFAQKAIATMARDARFLGFATVSLSFVISNKSDSDKTKFVRMTALSQDGRVLLSTEGPIEGFKNVYGIGFE